MKHETATLSPRTVSGGVNPHSRSRLRDRATSNGLRDARVGRVGMAWVGVEREGKEREGKEREGKEREGKEREGERSAGYSSLFFLTVYLLMRSSRAKKGRSGDCERPSSVPAWVRRFTNKSTSPGERRGGEASPLSVASSSVDRAVAEYKVTLEVLARHDPVGPSKGGCL